LKLAENIKKLKEKLKKEKNKLSPAYAVPSLTMTLPPLCM